MHTTLFVLLPDLLIKFVKLFNSRGSTGDTVKTPQAPVKNKPVMRINYTCINCYKVL